MSSATTATTSHHNDHRSSTDSSDSTTTTSTNSTAVLAYPLSLDSAAQQSLLQLSLFPITLKFEEVVYKVKVRTCNEKVAGAGGSWWPGSQGTTSREKTILSGLSGMVCSGELLGLLGPSGSGKTTLLTALAGRSLSGKLSGKISYNARPFSGSVKRRTGFVSQNDVLYPHLTVSETLLFTALLRLPESLTRAEKAAHVDRVVAELGLSRCRDTMIGGPLLRGISGGEKKRVSIGQEMLINPSLLLLDEPTSGLDSTAAQWILTTLKNLSAAGRTVVTTIHQPSSRLYHMFDKVLLLSEGGPLYYGPASRALDHFSEAGFSSPLTLNPADLMLDLANGISPAAEQPEKKASVKEALVKAYDERISPGLRAQLAVSDTEPLTMMMKPEYQSSSHSSPYTSWWHQFAVLLQRGIKERRHETFNQLRIFQVVSVASLGGLLWWQTPESNIGDRVALLFFFSVFWGFYPLYNAVFTFPQERAMLVKERSSGMYRLSSYFLSKTVGDLPLELALPTAFVSIIYWMGGLDPHPGTFLLTLLVVLYSVLVSQSLGLAVGAVLMDIKKATTLASVITLVFLMAGGYYVQHIPPFIVWLKYVSYSYYCYKLLLGVHYAAPHRTYDCGPGTRCLVADFPAVKSMHLESSPWLDVFYMFLMLVGYRFLAYLALRRLHLR